MLFWSEDNITWNDSKPRKAAAYAHAALLEPSLHAEETRPTCAVNKLQI